MKSSAEALNWLSSADIQRKFDIEQIPVSGGQMVVLHPVENNRTDFHTAAEFLNTVPEQAELLIVIVDCDGRVVQFNQVAQRATGYSEPEVSGATLWERLLPQRDWEEARRKFASLIDTKTSARQESVWITRNGTALRLALSSTVITNLDGRAAYVVLNGIQLDRPMQSETDLAKFSETALLQMQRDRRKLSRFLHDTVSQDLVALSFSLGRLQVDPRSASSKSALDQGHQLLDRCCRNIRQLTYILAPPIVSDDGLMAALHWYGGELQREIGMQVELDFDAIQRIPSQEVQEVLFATLQACVARSIRLRDNSRKRVSLKQRDDGLKLSYIYLEQKDSKENAESVFEDFAVIRQRLLHLNGTLEVQIEPDSMSINLFVPFGG